MEKNERQNDFPIHFICGMSRAGTTWMKQCLNTHKHCAAFGETLFWGRLYIEPKDGEYDEKTFHALVSRIAEIKLGYSNTDYDGLKRETVKGWHSEIPKRLSTINKKTAKEMFITMCQYVLESENKSVAVEKTPHHINWLPRISKELPSSKFIVMVRDPYGFMKSYKYQGTQKGEEVRRLFERQYHPLQAALIWRGYAKSILSALHQYDGRVKLIKNEELIAHSKEILLDVADFLDLPKDKNFASTIPQRANSSIMGNKDRSLGAEDIFWLRFIAKKQIRELGYPLQDSSFEIVPIIKTFANLPLWLVRTIVLLRSNSKANLFKYILRWLK